MRIYLHLDHFGAGKRPGFNHAHNFKALLPARIWNKLCFALRDAYDDDDDGTRLFRGEDNSAISQPIKLKLSGMVDFTIAQVIYYVPCLFFIGITLKYRKNYFISIIGYLTKENTRVNTKICDARK